MRILLDECLPRDLRKHFRGYECDPAAHAGLAGIANGELLAQAERSGWQVLLTMDQGIPYQQNLEGRTILVIVIRAQSNRLADLLPHVPEIQDLLQSIEPGRTIPIG